jgi:hypothetical protein
VGGFGGGTCNTDQGQPTQVDLDLQAIYNPAEQAKPHRQPSKSGRPGSHLPNLVMGFRIWSCPPSSMTPWRLLAAMGCLYWRTGLLPPGFSWFPACV